MVLTLGLVVIGGAMRAESESPDTKGLADVKNWLKKEDQKLADESYSLYKSGCDIAQVKYLEECKRSLEASKKTQCKRHVGIFE